MSAPLWCRTLGVLGFLTLAAGTATHAQTTFTESFTGTTAPGWNFGGNYTPNLTANNVDTPGTGWLRLTDNANNRATYALLDTEIFSVNARIEITMDYAFYNGSGADGITFFLVDGDINASSFDAGSYGGSMGYAQRTGEGGMVGGYLGFALDNFGNYSNASEGRNGGITNNNTLYPNRVAVRGPESSNYAFIAASNPLPSQMDFPTYTTRPDQTGADYRAFKIILDANNQLEVLMQFGATNLFQSVFTADLSAYERPETFKIGFTGATGGSTEIHEVRNVSLVSTPWSTGSGAYEWDDGAGNDNWGNTNGGEGNNNWYSAITGDNNKPPLRDSDILFGERPSAGPQTVNVNNNVEVRNMTFDSPYNYTLSGTGTITFGDTGKAGLPSINVNNYNEQNANGSHKINNDLEILENIAIRNFSYSTLCLNGDIDLGSRTITTSGYGLTNFNGEIDGSGPIIANGASTTHGTSTGIVTISGNNASSYTGAITVNGGQLVALHNGALGNTGSGTTINNGGTLTFRGGISTSEPTTINGSGTAIGLNKLAGAIYNDGGNNTLSGTVTLGSNAAIGSRDGTLTLTGTLQATTRNLTKIGEGTVALQGTSNMWSGGTFIMQEGALRFDSAASFSTGANYQLNGGVMEIGANLTSGGLTLGLGSGANQLRWTGDGGFSAFGADRSVAFDWLGNTQTWGAANFVQTGHALVLGSKTSTHNLIFENGINLGNQQREIRAINGLGVVDGTVKNLTGSGGGILKTGDGTLQLSGTNTYTGATEVRAGALRGAVSANSNLVLSGGVRELAADTTLALGTGAGQVRWTGSGGFAALDAPRTLTISGGDLTWGQTHFVALGNELILGSRSANNTLVLANNLALGNDTGTRTLRTIQGTNSSLATGTLTGVVSGSANLAVTGNGRLDLSANNTHTGAISVTGADLRLTGANGDLAQSSGFTVRHGGTLTLDNTAANNTNRIGDSASVALSGGSLQFLGATAASSETIGVVTLSAGANTINIQRNGTNSAQLTAASLSRTTGATVDFTNTAGGGTLGTAGANPRAVFTSAPAQTNGILAYATVNGASFATHGANGIAAITPDFLSAYTATLNAGQDTTTGLAGATDRQVNSITFTTGSLDLSSRNLDVVSGGLLSTGATASSIFGAGTLTSSSGELITHVYGSGGFTIASQITNSGATPVAFTKSGDGTLTLSGTTANTYTGTTTVNAGTLVLAKSADTTAIPGNLLIGDGRGTDTVRLSANEQIANTATVTLRGGELGNAANVARLEMNGATNDSFGSRVERFATLNIEGNTVLDFGGGTPCSPTFLYLDFLNVAANSLLTITNWIEFTDFLLVDKTTFDSTQLSRVIFEGYGGAASWKSYDSDYYQIIPFTPVPEPSTYGVLALGGLLGLATFRRRRRSA